MTDPTLDPAEPDEIAEERDEDAFIGDAAAADADDAADEESDGESTLRVTVAVPEQAEAVYDVLRRSFAEQATLNPPTGVTGETVATITAAIDSGQTIVALLDGEVVGTVRYNLLSDSLHLGRLGVLPEHRRSGVATALIEWCQEVLAPAEGRTIIDVEVRAALPANVNLFRGLGFTEIGSYAHPRNPKATVRKLRWRA